MHDTWLPLLLLLLGATVVVLLVQSWRLGRIREIAGAQHAIARANVAAAERESDRHAAAYARGFRAREGERAACGLLERAGYEVVGRQVPGSWTLRADGTPVTFGLRADYLVACNGRRYIAEVKTGRMAPRLSHGATRRQLLEYRAAFDVHGVILVDADAETVVHIEMDMFTGVVPRSEFDGIHPRVVTIAVAVSLSIGILVGAVMAK
ncbi:MAG: hypothetical protein M3O46_14445 [Myxococcota bacterium]|nr:hypothetical protein [Myxococcota bacterium]